MFARGQKAKAMCRKCKELDVQIVRCERLRDQVTDKLLLDGLIDLVKAHLADKLALHSSSALGLQGLRSPK